LFRTSLRKTEARAAELETEKVKIEAECATLQGETERLASAAKASAAEAAAAAADAKHSKGAIQALLGQKMAPGGKSGSSSNAAGGAEARGAAGAGAGDGGGGGAAIAAEAIAVLPNNAAARLDSTSSMDTSGSSNGGLGRAAVLAAELDVLQKKMKQALLKNTKLESTVQMLRTQLLEYATDSEDEDTPKLTGDARVDDLQKQLAEAAARECVHLEEIEKNKDWQRMYKKIVQSFFGEDGKPLSGSPPLSPEP